MRRAEFTHWFLRGRAALLQCNARWQLSRQDPSGTSHYICVCLQDAQHVGPMLPRILAGRRITFSSRLHLRFCRLPACHDAASAEYEDVCVSESVPGIFYNNNPVGKCLPHPAFPFLSLRVATLPKPAPTPCARKICVKLVTQRHASHTNQPLTYVSTVQGQRDDRSNLRPVSRRKPKNSRR